MTTFTSLPPLGLYIHFPWCVEKCPYCDFNSHRLKTALPAEEYIDCLILDLENELPSVWGRSVHSIFMGGGTPSLFPAEMIDKLLQGFRARLNFSPDIEITLEANPGTVDQQQFHGYRQAGVNRLSMGIQSFNDSMLKKLGRIHNSEQAISAIEAAKMAGFNNFNLDLMYGLPEQTMQQMLDDLQTAFEFDPPHLSHYQLTIEPNTLFASKPPSLPIDDEIWEMTQQAHKLLARNKYTQYEVSAFSKQLSATNRQQCKHNINYWQFGDYLGIGAGAHQKISSAQTQSIHRCMKQKHPTTYIQAVRKAKHILDRRNLSEQDIIFEFMLNALRLTDGFNLQTFTEHSGLNPDKISNKLKKAQQQNFIMVDNNKVTPTEHGKQFLNNLISLFLPE